MLTLTRRSFLKSLATLAASVAVPVEVSKTIDFLLEQPEIPITKNTPSGYISLNGTLIPLAGARFDKEMGSCDFLYKPDRQHPGKFIQVGRFQSAPAQLNATIEVFGKGSLNHIESQIRSWEPIEFLIVPYKSNLKISGNGYIDRIEIERTPLILRTIGESEFDKISFDMSIIGELEWSCKNG